MIDPWIHALNTWHDTHDEYSSKNMATVTVMQFIYEYKQLWPYGLVIRVKVLIPAITWIKSLFGDFSFHFRWSCTYVDTGVEPKAPLASWDLSSLKEISKKPLELMTTGEDNHWRVRPLESTTKQGC